MANRLAVHRPETSEAIIVEETDAAQNQVTPSTTYFS